VIEEGDDCAPSLGERSSRCEDARLARFFFSKRKPRRNRNRSQKTMFTALAPDGSLSRVSIGKRCGLTTNYFDLMLDHINHAVERCGYFDLRGRLHATRR